MENELTVKEVMPGIYLMDEMHAQRDRGDL